MVIVAVTESGPFMSVAGINDWLIADGSNAVIGLLNRVAGPTALSSDDVTQYAIGKNLPGPPPPLHRVLGLARIIDAGE